MQKRRRNSREMSWDLKLGKTHRYYNAELGNKPKKDGRAFGSQHAAKSHECQTECQTDGSWQLQDTLATCWARWLALLDISAQPCGNVWPSRCQKGTTPATLKEISVDVNWLSHAWRQVLCLQIAARLIPQNTLKASLLGRAMGLDMPSLFWLRKDLVNKWHAPCGKRSKAKLNSRLIRTCKKCIKLYKTAMRIRQHAASVRHFNCICWSYGFAVWIHVIFKWRRWAVRFS